MDPKGNITDAFDDDSLRRSISAAEKGGEWRDEDAKFVDPKLKDLERKLATVPREDYTERRRQELQRRIAEKEAQMAPRDRFEEAPDWRETVVQPTAAETGTGAPTAAPATAPPRRERFTPASLRPYVPFFLAAAVVVVLGTGVQSLLAGWHHDVVVRAVLASLTTAVAWRHFAAGRLSMALIATCIHLTTALSTARIGDRRELFAIFAGMIVVLIAAGAVGMLRTESDARQMVGR
jgi:hypothetical protein